MRMMMMSALPPQDGFGGSFLCDCTQLGAKMLMLLNSARYWWWTQEEEKEEL